MSVVRDIIIPVFTVLTSVVAIIFTYLGLRIQRKHNFKSLIPIGKIRAFDYENLIQIRVDNYGTGPLIIKSVMIDGKDIGDERGVIDYIPSDFADSLTWKNFTANYPGRAIPPNENLEMLSWSPETYEDKGKSERDKQTLRKHLKDLTIEVKYHGVYENELFSDETDLSWYGRNL